MAACKLLVSNTAVYKAVLKMVVQIWVFSLMYVQLRRLFYISECIYFASSSSWTTGSLVQLLKITCCGSKGCAAFFLFSRDWRASFWSASTFLCPTWLRLFVSEKNEMINRNKKWCNITAFNLLHNCKECTPGWWIALRHAVWSSLCNPTYECFSFSCYLPCSSQC